MHVVSAWCSQNGGLVMGQLKRHSKSNVITAIPELLGLLAIKGCTVTTETMGCQRAIVSQITNTGIISSRSRSITKGPTVPAPVTSMTTSSTASACEMRTPSSMPLTSLTGEPFDEAFGYYSTLAALLNWRSGPGSTRSWLSCGVWRLIYYDKSAREPSASDRNDSCAASQ